MNATITTLWVAVVFFAFHGVFSVIGIFTIPYERYDFMLGGIVFLILTVLFNQGAKND